MKNCWLGHPSGKYESQLGWLEIPNVNGNIKKGQPVTTNQKKWHWLIVSSRFFLLRIPGQVIPQLKTPYAPPWFDQNFPTGGFQIFHINGAFGIRKMKVKSHLNPTWKRWLKWDKVWEQTCFDHLICCENYEKAFDLWPTYDPMGLENRLQDFTAAKFVDFEACLFGSQLTDFEMKKGTNWQNYTIMVL